MIILIVYLVLFWSVSVIDDIAVTIHDVYCFFFFVCFILLIFFSFFFALA